MNTAAIYAANITSAWFRLQVAIPDDLLAETLTIIDEIADSNDDYDAAVAIVDRVMAPADPLTDYVAAYRINPTYAEWAGYKDLPAA